MITVSHHHPLIIAAWIVSTFWTRKKFARKLLSSFFFLRSLCVYVAFGDFEASDTTDLICQKFLDTIVFVVFFFPPSQLGNPDACRKSRSPFFGWCAIPCVFLFIWIRKEKRGRAHSRSSNSPAYTYWYSKYHPYGDFFFYHFSFCNVFDDEKKNCDVFFFLVFVKGFLLFSGCC